MATNGAQPSANNNAMRTTNDRPNFSQVLTNMTLRNLTTEQQKDYREYLVAHLFPGLETRGLGNTTIWAENEIHRDSTGSHIGHETNPRQTLRQPPAFHGSRLQKTPFEAINTAVPRFVESLLDALGLQLGIHTITMNQKRLDHIFDQVQAMHDELRKRLDDFDQQALDRAGPLAQAISDEVVNRRLKGMFVSFKKDIDARVQSHESANEKQQREFEATLNARIDNINARIDNINARIDNTTKTQCEKALQPHLKELDEAKATVASFRKQLGQHVTDANTTLGHLKQQQTSNASEMETLRKDHSNFVLSNSSDFQTLRTTVEKREKTIKSQDEAIEKINNDIVRIKKNGLDVLSAVKIVGQRSRSNREVLRKTLRHVIEVEHVALKVEEALLEMDILDDQGFLKPNEKRPKDSRLDKSAYELGHKDNNPLEADPSCITLLQEDQAPAQAAGEQPPPPAS